MRSKMPANSLGEEKRRITNVGPLTGMSLTVPLRMSRHDFRMGTPASLGGSSEAELPSAEGVFGKIELWLRLE
jgi:hypothetical protein